MKKTKLRESQTHLIAQGYSKAQCIEVIKQSYQKCAGYPSGEQACDSKTQELTFKLQNFEIRTKKLMEEILLLEARIKILTTEKETFFCSNF